MSLQDKEKTKTKYIVKTFTFSSSEYGFSTEIKDHHSTTTSFFPCLISPRLPSHLRSYYEDQSLQVLPFRMIDVDWMIEWL